MPAPDDRRYSDSHEWHKPEGDVVVIGITQFAVDQLTDVTFVEMKAVGTSLSKGDAIGEVESVKTTSDIYCHVDGEIVEVNDALGDNPGLINEDCYGKGWLVKVKASNASQLDEMMDAGAYADSGGA
ncbi:glycine cleavage system protein H [Leptolyngbya valderiana BDU 20041]|nr:glycine cleavage system protein H [Leptolyngbya valderiana BDU 20041]